MGLLYNALTMNNSIERLYLNHNDLKGPNIYCWEDVILKNSSIKTLSLSHCNLGNEGAVIIADAIQLNKNIVELHLKGNSISDFAGKAILEAMKWKARPQLQ